MYWSVRTREKRPNRTLLQILHQPLKPHKTRCIRKTRRKTHERKRTLRSTKPRTKHDLPQPKTPAPMQLHLHKKTRQKTHLLR